MHITAIERKRGSRRVTLRVDHCQTVPLSTEVLALLRLRAGDELTEQRLKEVREAQARHEAISSALRLLSYRQRSERELRDRLARKRVPQPLCDEVIARLRELSLIDDEAFALSYVQARDQTSPRGRRLLAQELRTKGIPRRAIEGPLAGVDESGAAYRAAARRARSLAPQTHADFRRRLGGFLLRRGFDYEVSRATTDRLWREMGSDGAASAAAGHISEA